MIFLFGVLLFLRLIIPPAVAGGIVKIAFLRDFSFLTLIIPLPGGGGIIKDYLPAGTFFFCTYLSLACRPEII